jgi:hypothetical protein
MLLGNQTTVSGQKKKLPISCKSEIFNSLMPLPELTYQCPADIPSDSDDRILKLPDRQQALRRMVITLESLTDARWWTTPVSDLNACYIRGQAGELSEDETSQFNGVEHQTALLGNQRIRLLVIPDPCYQTSYNGSNAFLLYRSGSKVYVTQVLDGYFSRLDNSIFLHLFPAQPEKIEIETANITAMRPDYTHLTFVIDKVTHKAVRKSPPGRSRS